jgi:hypothetical protein
MARRGRWRRAGLGRWHLVMQKWKDFLCIGRINEIVKDVRKAWIVFLLFEVGQHEMPCI